MGYLPWSCNTYKVRPCNGDIAPGFAYSRTGPQHFLLALRAVMPHWTTAARRHWRAGTLTGVLDGRIYDRRTAPVAQRGCSRASVYDPATDRWTRLATLPSAPPRRAAGGLIYGAGGFGRGFQAGAQASTYVYDRAGIAGVTALRSLIPQ